MDSKDKDAFLNERIRPGNCDIQVEYFDADLTITVPPAGLWKGTGGLFTFSLIWNGAILLFSVLVAFAIARVPQADAPGWVVLGVLGLFWAVGIIVLLSSINMGLRRAAIAVAGDTLMVIQTGPLGTKSKEWRLADLSDIVAGPSGMKVNDVDVLELQIHARDQGKYGMLAGRRSAELVWLARLLREATLSPAADCELAPQDEHS